MDASLKWLSCAIIHVLFCSACQVYYISRANLKTANKQYSNVNNNYEMTLNPDSVIELCTDESDLPTWSFDFKKLKDLAQVEPASIIGKFNNKLVLLN